MEPNKSLPINQMPEALKALPQWVVWSWEVRDGKKTKIPYSPATGRRAAVNDPDTWGTFEAAYKLYLYAPGAAGLGFVFTVDDPFCGIDLDKCVNVAGELSEDARRVIGLFSSYSEVSPSGTGVKVIIRAVMPGSGLGRRSGQIEAYDRGRFFTITGNRLDGPAEPEEKQAAVDQLVAAMDAESGGRAEYGGIAAPCAPGLDDRELIALVERSKQGPKFRRLWGGEITGYESHSEADFALCSILAFWCGGDEGQVDRLFRASGLMRDKWNDKRGSQTYGQMTLTAAVAHRTVFYQPKTEEPAATGLPPDGERMFLWMSELKVMPANEKWILEGYISRGGVTLLSAYWKAGKTTWLAHMLKALESDGEFCGLKSRKSKVLMIAEEDQTLWAERRDDLGIRDHVGICCRPFVGRPTMQQWSEFLRRIHQDVVDYKFDLVIFDTLAKLWPVREENNASQVDEALMPMWMLVRDGLAGAMAVHHMRKGEGTEATSSRGSGALTAFVETIVELRRFDPSNRKCRKRVLDAYGRYPETPDQLVVELTPSGYVACGDREMVRDVKVRDGLLRIMQKTPPGMTYEAIASNWPDDKVPTKTDILSVLKAGYEVGVFIRSGKGVKGDPHYYWINPEANTAGAA